MGIKSPFTGAVEDSPERPESLRVYVVNVDFGMAPNVTDGICTLATCKPALRAYTDLGRQWIVGMGGAKSRTPDPYKPGGLRTENWKDRLIYVMAPEERLTYDEYYNDPRFQSRIPKAENDPGDNIYFQDNTGKYRVTERFNDVHKVQAGKPFAGFMDNDMRNGPYVLVARKFWYFGDQAPSLYEQASVSEGLAETLRDTFRGHKIVAEPNQVTEFSDWLHQNFKPGIHGKPRQEYLLEKNMLTSAGRAKVLAGKTLSGRKQGRFANSPDSMK